MSKPHGVWITGVGAVTPLGRSYREIADNLLAGKSGIRKVTSFPVTDHPCRIAGMIDEIPVPAGWDASSFAVLPAIDRLVASCTATALQDAGWWDRRRDVRIGLVLGSGAEWLRRWEADQLQGGDIIHHPERETESQATRTRKHLGLTGPSMTVSAACASGNYAFAQARQWLERGWVDVCLAGAGDLSVTPMALAGFGNLRALSRRNDDPQHASRPFDRNRDGFVMGEGGAFFVLERQSDARKRGARAYAELAGCGASSDAHNMVIPSPHPEPATAAIRQALADAQVSPCDVDYLNAHATSTPVGDAAEARVLQAVFGSALGRVPVSSTKSMTGHLLTAAAAVEALACVIAMDRRALPPTINLDDPDPACPLLHVANQSREKRVRIAISNSFGFGGSNTCVVFRAA